MVGRKRNSTFKWLKERVWQEVSNWKKNFLSQVGREILIKAVFQAIPVYTMSLYQLPKSLCAKITSLIVKFWWDTEKCMHKIH